MLQPFSNSSLTTPATFHSAHATIFTSFQLYHRLCEHLCLHESIYETHTGRGSQCSNTSLMTLDS